MFMGSFLWIIIKKKNPLRDDSEWVRCMCLIYNDISIIQTNPIYLHISKFVGMIYLFTPN